MKIEPYVVKPVEYLPYDPLLPRVVDVVVTFIQRALPEARFEHIGSTAIPQMPGKNSINLQLLISQEHYQDRIAILKRLGFVPSPSPLVRDAEPVLVASVRYKSLPYSVHILLTPPNSPYHRSAVLFRDYLLSHPSVAKEYAKIKERAVAEGKTDPLAYNKAKEPFILNILGEMN